LANVDPATLVSVNDIVVKFVLQ